MTKRVTQIDDNIYMRNNNTTKEIMKYDLEIKYYSNHWMMRVFHPSGNVVQAYTGLIRNHRYFEKCKEKVLRIYENIQSR